MSETLKDIAGKLKGCDKKVHLIYGFNGVGKTRLSREFKYLVTSEDIGGDEDEKNKIIYYNAFTEDLFYWDNDLVNDIDRKLKIQPNTYTDWIFMEQGQEQNVSRYFQYYTNKKLTPQFNEKFSEVKFSFERGDDSDSGFIKISKGEESCFIWSVFHTLLEEAITILNEPEESKRETDDFDKLEYVFIDDPVSSLDDSHLIELAVNIAELIKSSESKKLKFILTTHNPLFYNVLCNEFSRGESVRKHRLEKLSDGTYSLSEQPNDSPFSYHLYLLNKLDKVKDSPDEIRKYHFNLLRNILEKTATFLGYKNWGDLLPKDSREAYYRRIINLSSHSKHNGQESSVINERERIFLKDLVEKIKTDYNFNL